MSIADHRQAAATVPPVRQLLSAMSGHWDRTDPYVQVLRAAWLLARFDDWFTPKAIIGDLHLVEEGELSRPIQETGATVLTSLGLGPELGTRQQLLDRITDEVGGDAEYATAVDRIAQCVGDFHRASNVSLEATDEALDALAKAKSDYEKKYE